MFVCFTSSQHAAPPPSFPGSILSPELPLGFWFWGLGGIEAICQKHSC